MELYVGHIPGLATEEALKNWFARAGLQVEAIDLVEEDDSGSQRGAWVKIAGEGFPSKTFRHLNGYAFWGRCLVVQKAERRTDDNPGRETRPRGSPEAA